MYILEQESNNKSECATVDVEALFSENGDSPQLMLCELSDQNMIIAASKLRNNEVRKSVFLVENEELKN